MSDTTIAIVILPVLIALTVLLECTRVGCTWAAQQLRSRDKPGSTPERNRSFSSLQ